jgi:hypothetical protein
MASTRIIVLFNLKPGVSVAEYEAWARAHDLPNVNRLPSVSGFEVLRTTGLLGSTAAPPYAYVEVLDVADMDAFGRDVATAVMQKTAAAFQGYAEAPLFITTDALAWREPA